MREATYNNGYYRFEYEYDSVGNHTQMVSGMTTGQVITTTYALTTSLRARIRHRQPPDERRRYHLHLGRQRESFAGSGQALLFDGLNTCTLTLRSGQAYDQADRLISVMSMPPAVTYTYNGLGDRVQQIYAGSTTTYLLDIASGLTQVLADGESTYLYGLGRIGEEGAAGWQYHLQNAMQKLHGILAFFA